MRLDQSNPLIPYLLLLPHAVFFLWFTIYPVFSGLLISLQRWDPLRDNPPFVGFEHYAKLFDPASLQFQKFWGSMINTSVFVLISVPLLVIVALLLALALNRPVRGRSFFRSVLFLPTILSVSVVSLLWRWMFGDDIGLIDSALASIGIQAPHFLTTTGWAWVPIVASTVWWSVGLNMMLYLAGLSGIPESYDEAAQLDGANVWERFRYITLPLLSPTTLFVTVTTILASFQMFGQAQLITGGDPRESTTTVLMYITNEAFTNNQISSATAMSFVFGALMLVVTVAQFRAMARGVKGPAS